MPVYVTESGNLVGDAKWSHDVCAVIMYCRKYLRNLLKGQQMLATVKQVLRYISHFDLISTPHNKHSSSSLEILLCTSEFVFQADGY